MNPMDSFERMEAAPTPGPAEGGALVPEQFARRFQASGRLLWTIAAGVLGDTHEVEDVLQEACVLALEKLDSYREDAHFTAWMGRFVRHVAWNHARKRLRRDTRPVAPEELLGLEARGDLRARVPRAPVDAPVPPASAGGSASDGLPVDARGELVADQTAFDDLVVAALGELGPIQRAALLLRTVHELSYRELAAVLEIPEGTAMSHVHRARRTLREALPEALHGADRPEPAPSVPSASGPPDGPHEP